MSGALSPAEEAIMKATFKATMLRAADIIDGISGDDVLEKQADLLRNGMSLTAVSRLDRAHLAAAWLRLCAEGKVPSMIPSYISPQAVMGPELISREPIRFTRRDARLMIELAAAMDPNFDDSFEAALSIHGSPGALFHYFNLQEDERGYVWSR